MSAFLDLGVHIFECENAAHIMSSSSFVASLLAVSSFGGTIVWVSQTLLAHEAGVISGQGLQEFGIDPDRILFVHAKKATDVLWVLEQALGSPSVEIAIGELKNDKGILDLKSTRRLSLRSAASDIPVHLISAGKTGATAALSRWKVEPFSRSGFPWPRTLGWSAWRLALIKNKKGIYGDQSVSFEPTERRFVSEKLPATSATHPQGSTPPQVPAEIIAWDPARRRAGGLGPG
ncbi:hypothetical protein DLJ53_23000 [Acuticoccus sediminis]|uniref:Uncharacterized protein n=1 Tax=Acuticoccus sediminis TaxID=2184697 RepID=A0A8B2NNE8_9HYPH|nr:hypothetical protein [Acuticoccus sediminis]RAH99397.1 hypothetical protein DLJ53_23000 [Acuticoccus sediminis]